MIDSTTREEVQQAAPLAAMTLASRSFVEFLTEHVWILERPQPGIPGHRVKMQPWPHIIEFAQQLERPWTMAKEDIKPEDLHTVAGKARQVGFSWTVAAFAAWLARFRDGALVLMESEGQDAAAELLSKTKYVYLNMPEAWQHPFDAKSTEHLSFVGSESEIKALPSTQKAGHGFQASIVILDEADNHEHLALNMGAIQPTIDAGGQLVLLSTVEKMKSASMFQNIYRRAMVGKGGYHKIFVPYDARPGRDEEWYEKRKEPIPPEDLKGMTPALYMEQNYPRNEEEMLSPPRAGSFFEPEALKYMRQFCREPMISSDGFSIYEKFILGHKYAAGTDVGEGVGRDYSVTVVLDLTTMRVVADIMSNEISADDLVYWSFKMLEMYRWPLWAIENNFGSYVPRKARELRYRRLFREHTKKIQGGTDHLKDTPGWHMDGKNRFDVYNDMKAQVDALSLVIYNKAGLQQFADVIRKMDNAGNYVRPEARAGANDDYPVAVGVALQMARWVGNAMGGESGKPVPRPVAY